MIYGVGNDLLKIDRVRARTDNERFMTFCFSEEERAAFAQDARRLAGCFAAKEAFSKALGTGVRGFTLDEISVLRDGLGKPYMEFSGNAREIVTQLNVRVHTALTNTDKYVMATVILEEAQT